MSTIGGSIGTEVVWHYTYKDSFSEILASDIIRHSTINVANPCERIVWFSTNQRWERTVYKAVVDDDGGTRQLGMEGLLNLGIELYRIGVDPATAPLTWPEIQRVCRMPRKTAHTLLKLGRQWGANAAQWRASVTPVAREMWRAIERFENGKWIEHL